MKVAEIERQRRQVAEERERIGGELTEVYQREREKSAGPLNLESLRAVSQYVRTLCARGRAADLHLGKIAKKKEAALAELVEANRNVKLLENVREDRVEAWRNEVAREDQAFLDELGVGGFRRRRGGVVRVAFFLILALALVGGGVFAYKKGYLSKDYWRQLPEVQLNKVASSTAPSGAAISGGISAPAASATQEASSLPPDVIYDPTEEVFYFASELGKNLRVSSVLKQLDEQKARIREKEEALARREEDLLRRERDLLAREDEVEAKWKDALAALEANQKIIAAQDSREARERREMIARLAKNIGSARPANGAELIQHVDESILPEVLKEITDAKLSKILEQLGTQAAEQNRSAAERLKLIMNIMGKVEEATGEAKSASAARL